MIHPKKPIIPQKRGLKNKGNAMEPAETTCNTPEVKNCMCIDQCRVCGYSYGNFHPWGNDEETPSYDICICCGVEFGNEDYCIDSIRKYREEWIRSGAKWYSINERPAEWNINVQIRNIPEKYR